MFRIEDCNLFASFLDDRKNLQNKKHVCVRKFCCGGMMQLDRVTKSSAPPARCCSWYNKIDNHFNNYKAKNVLMVTHLDSQNLVPYDVTVNVCLVCSFTRKSDDIITGSINSNKGFCCFQIQCCYSEQQQGCKERANT